MNRVASLDVKPFVGGGALLFYLLGNYKFDEVIINDVNKDLINLYLVIKNEVEKLIVELKKISDEYLILNDKDRKEYYYKIRNEFNGIQQDTIKKSAYFIFLNRTCFNGLYRVNKKGKFNVPCGKYKNPLILDEKNLLNVSRILKDIKILNDDFEIIGKYVDEYIFVYLDPPYVNIIK